MVCLDSFKQTYFLLNNTATQSEHKDQAHFEPYEQKLLCRAEMQTGLAVICGLRGEKGHYSQDLLFLLSDTWQSKLPQQEEILIQW